MVQPDRQRPFRAASQARFENRLSVSLARSSTSLAQLDNGIRASELAGLRAGSGALSPLSARAFLRGDREGRRDHRHNPLSDRGRPVGRSIYRGTRSASNPPISRHRFEEDPRAISLKPVLIPGPSQRSATGGPTQTVKGFRAHTDRRWCLRIAAGSVNRPRPAPRCPSPTRQHSAADL